MYSIWMYPYEKAKHTKTLNYISTYGLGIWSMAMMMMGVSHQIKNQKEIHQTHLRAKVSKVLHLRKMNRKARWFSRKEGWPLTLNSCECSDFVLSWTDSREMVIFQVKMYHKQLLTLIDSNMWPQPSTHQFPSCNSWFLLSSLLKRMKTGPTIWVWWLFHSYEISEAGGCVQM